MVVAAALQAVPRRLQPTALGAYLAICYGLFGFWLVVTPHTGGMFGKGPTHVPWILALGTLPLLAVCAAIQVHALAATRSSTRFG